METKIRVDREQGDRDFIKAASEIAEEALAFHAEQQTLTGSDDRCAVTLTYLFDMAPFLTETDKMSTSLLPRDASDGPASNGENALEAGSFVFPTSPTAPQLSLTDPKLS